MTKQNLSIEQKRAAAYKKATKKQLFEALTNISEVLNPDDHDGGYFICEEAEDYIDEAMKLIGDRD